MQLSFLLALVSSPVPAAAILMRTGLRGSIVGVRGCEHSAGLFPQVCLLLAQGDASRHLAYCLSYTVLFLGLLPSAPASPVVTIRDLPSPDTTIRPVRVTFPSFLTVSFNTRSPIFWYDRMSEVGSPVTG